MKNDQKWLKNVLKSEEIVNWRTGMPNIEYRSAELKFSKNLVPDRYAINTIPVINHGISEEMMSEVISLNKEFFVMPAEEKAGFYCEGFYHNIKLYTSGYNYYAEDVHYWKDTLKLPCNPLESHLHSWPQRPHKYRKATKSVTKSVEVLLKTVYFHRGGWVVYR
ncbi:hypothetical protein LguiA_013005 [Lonicera macranthoides]